MPLRRSRVDYLHSIFFAALQLLPFDQHQSIHFRDHLAAAVCLRNQRVGIITTEVCDRGLSHFLPLQIIPQSLSIRRRRGRNERRRDLIVTLAALGPRTLCISASLSNLNMRFNVPTSTLSTRLLLRQA
jgi:hypothetical protein